MRRTTIASLLVLFFVMAPPATLAQTPPVAPPGTVTLPLGEYDRLVERAARPPVVPELPPVAAVVARADVQVRVSPTDVRGTATLQGEVLRAGRVKVPLMDGATLLEVLQNGAVVPVLNDSGTIAAILNGPSSFTLTVSFASDVTSEPGRAGAVLPAFRAGTVRAVIEAPGDDVDIRVDTGLLGSRTSAEGKTRVAVTLTPRQPARMTWSSREQAVKAPREVRIVSDVKSLVTVAEGDLRVASLFDVVVLQGQPDQLDVQVPDGFEVVSVSGGSVESSGQQGNRLPVTLREPTRRRHQFLVTLERNAAGGVQHAELAIPGVQAVQRETGEIAWEAVGTVDLTATEASPLRRIDVKEVNASLASLARSPLLSAFRYQRRGVERVPVTFDVRRFPDAPVLGALAQNATVTTLVSSEGRALTDFAMLMRNRGQLFLKVALPKGATLLAATVGGQTVKPVEAPDGARVPLVRPGFQPSSVYDVSFVYVEAGTSFDKKGQAEMKLPRLDVPIETLTWELFLPDRYKVKRFDGDALPETLFIPVVSEKKESPVSRSTDYRRTGTLRGDQVGGVVVDPGGAVIPGAVVTIAVGDYRRSAVTTASGSFEFSNIPAGRVEISVALQGFRPFTATLAAPGVSIRVPLQVGTVSESVQVTAPTQTLKESQAPSQNVLNLQERLSGVLPVRIDVPRSGQAFRFVRQLVLDEETVVRFEYKAK